MPRKQPMGTCVNADPATNHALAQKPPARPSAAPDRGSPVADETPFFIVGASRSGTTLLRAIIASHSAITIPWETWFILDLLRRFAPDKTLTPDEVDLAVEIMTRDHNRWRNMEMTRAELAREAAALRQPRLVDIIGIVYRNHIARSGKRRFGDKTPPYIDIVRELDQLYPGAKFIHLVRDGRDVAMSFIELRWQGDPRYYEREFEWRHALRCRDSYRGLPVDKQILDVKYEDLVVDPEATVRRICGFLGETFEPAMLDPAARAASVPEAERSIHAKLGEPLSAASIAKWRGKLSAWECFLMEACLHRELRRWDYELRFSSIGWRPLLNASGWLLLRLGPLLARAVPALQRRNYLPRSIYI
jgi:hypothetical protein